MGLAFPAVPDGLGGQAMAWEGKGSAAISDTAAATFLTIPIRQGAERLWASFTNGSGGKLDAFQVDIRSGGSDTAPYMTIANAASDYTTNIQWPILGCSVDLVTLAVSASAGLAMDIKATQSIRFKASCAASSDTTLAYYWSVR